MLRPSEEAVRAALARLDARLAGSRIKPANSHTPPRWEWPRTAERCLWCKRSVLQTQLLYKVKTRPTFTYGHDGPTGGVRILSAECLDHRDCKVYRDRKREVSGRRRGVTFVLEKPPREGEHKGRGFCRWCGEAIILTDPTEYRRASREYHRGDQFETGSRNCRAEWHLSYTSEARMAVIGRDLRTHGRGFCAQCGTVCFEQHPDRPLNHFWAVELEQWEADHRIPLEDGGEHTLDNLQCLCVPCHRRKTAQENRERAERRAKLPLDAPPAPPRSNRRSQRSPAPDPF